MLCRKFGTARLAGRLLAQLLEDRFEALDVAFGLDVVFLERGLEVGRRGGNSSRLG